TARNRSGFNSNPRPDQAHTVIPQLLRRSLAARLTAAFLGLSIGTVALATFVSYRVAERTLRERLLSHLETLADEDAAGLTTWYNRQRAAIELMARWESSRLAVRFPEGS